MNAAARSPVLAVRAWLRVRLSLVALAVCLLPLAFCLDTAANAQEAPPRLTAPVNDFAHIIDSSSAAELDRRIRALQAASGDVVAVATVQTFKPYGDINEFAVKMFENGGNGIGARGKDNGLLIVVAVDDRAIKIEVGYDLEQFITDGYAGETIRTVIAPQFRAGNYGAGVLAGATRIINRIAEGRGVTLEGVPVTRSVPRQGGSVSLLPIVIIIVLFILFSRGGGGPRRRRRVWGGGPWSGWNSGVGPFGGGGFGGGFGGFGGGGFGGGGGGFGGFGGGRSGGGGASGSW